jgi:hypothetical protein
VISIKPFISQMGKLRSGRKVPSAGWVSRLGAERGLEPGEFLTPTPEALPRWELGQGFGRQEHPPLPWEWSSRCGSRGTPPTILAHLSKGFSVGAWRWGWGVYHEFQWCLFLRPEMAGVLNFFIHSFIVLGIYWAC